MLYDLLNAFGVFLAVFAICGLAFAPFLIIESKR